jgi:hypothetical protein
MDSGGIVMPNWLLYKLGNFTWLDKEVALMFIKMGLLNELAYNLDNFTWLDEEIAKVLIEDGYSHRVEEILKKNPNFFKGQVA